VTGLPTADQLAGQPLSMLVFGMGLGESVLLRFEDAGATRWAVIDSARKKWRAKTINPALELLKRLGARPDVVVLTHPHRDHAKGMADLVRLAKPGALVGCVEPLMERSDELDAIALDDDRLANDIGQTVLAHAAIRSAWREARARKMSVLVEAGPFDLCGWQAEVLNPTEARAQVVGQAMSEGREPNLNEVSVALTLRRAGVTLLLAGDGERDAWSEVAARLHPDHLRDTHPVKVPHHGSFAALQPVVVDANQPSQRELVVTPFPQSGTLPRFGAGEGASILVRAGGSFLLTAMPVSVTPARQQVSLAEAAIAVQPRPFAEDDNEISTVPLAPDLTLEPTAAFQAGDRDPSECWVLCGVASDGTITTEIGLHALRVTA
jgi:beta-lactamase superfamily II metal-dependent hydrolase